MRGHRSRRAPQASRSALRWFARKAAARPSLPICRSAHAPRRNISVSSLILLDEVTDAGAEIIPAGVDRNDGGDPEQQQPDLGSEGEDLVAGFTGQQKSDR